MKPLRTLLPHAVALVLASTAAFAMWTRDKDPRGLIQGEVTIWAGRPDDVQRIAYEGRTKKLVLEAKKDELGRYFVGTFERDAVPSSKPTTDAGAEPVAAPAQTTVTFVAVANATKLAESLAPLRALRRIGAIDPARAADFGLTDPDGTLKVQVGQAAQELIIGGATPGGSDRYAKDPVSGELYVIASELFRDLDNPESRLLERTLHAWKDNDVDRVRVTAGGKSRELVRGSAEQKRFWADAATPTQNDETAGNWMTKLDRLRPTEYAASPPKDPELVARVDFSGGSATGFLELVRVAGTAEKPDYFIRTERTRRHAKVTRSLAEQVAEDLAAIVR
jgi:hypothetical protein